MAHDFELDRLKAAQDLAFRRKQDAWQAQDQAKQRRSQARDAMNRAYDEKQRAYEAQESSWQTYRRIQDANGPRIEQLKTRQQTAFENMGRAFDAASSAHDRRDGAMAKAYSNEGHQYKTEAQDATTERRRLIGEAQDAWARHEATKPAFQQAKDRFNRLKNEHSSAKADHERKQKEFDNALSEFERAKQAFRSRLEAAKAASKQRQDDKRSIAERAGVPFQYHNDVWVSTHPDGTINIYFGGAGQPNGPGHGHYVMDKYGNVTYRREPFEAHGGQNYVDNPDAALLYTRSARSDHEPLGTNEHEGVFYRRSDIGGTELHITQYFDDGYHVSWDATPTGNQNVHWTNKNVPNGHPDRFTPPSDAIL